MEKGKGPSGERCREEESDPKKNGDGLADGYRHERDQKRKEKRELTGEVNFCFFTSVPLHQMSVTVMHSSWFRGSRGVGEPNSDNLEKKLRQNLEEEKNDRDRQEKRA